LTCQENGTSDAQHAACSNLQAVREQPYRASSRLQVKNRPQCPPPFIMGWMGPQTGEQNLVRQAFHNSLLRASSHLQTLQHAVLAIQHQLKVACHAWRPAYSFVHKRQPNACDCCLLRHTSNQGGHPGKAGIVHAAGATLAPPMFNVPNMHAPASSAPMYANSQMWHVRLMAHSVSAVCTIHPAEWWQGWPHWVRVNTSTSRPFGCGLRPKSVS